jgi:hypothetical protein
MNIAVPISVRMRALSSGRVGAFHLAPSCVLYAVKVSATRTLYVEAAARTRNSRPRATAMAISLAVHCLSAIAASISPARGWWPWPKSDAIWDAVTTSPSVRPRLGSPEPIHRPGDSPFSS